jgi:RecB family exonuclease
MLWLESVEWTPTEGAARATQLLDEMIPEVAASLLLPGAGPQLRRCREAIPTAIKHLIELINEAKLSVVGCEMPFDSEVHDTKFGGTVDMLLRNTQGEHVILDMKWTRSPNYLWTKLAKGRALQLAAYSWLLAQNFKSPDPPAGFFLLRQSRLYFSDPEPFAESHVAGARDLSKTWSLAVDQFEETMRQLKDGRLTATGIDKSDDPDLLVDPPCNFCRLAHICGVKELK